MHDSYDAVHRLLTTKVNCRHYSLIFTHRQEAVGRREHVSEASLLTRPLKQPQLDSDTFESSPSTLQ